MHHIDDLLICCKDSTDPVIYSLNLLSNISLTYLLNLDFRVKTVDSLHSVIINIFYAFEKVLLTLRQDDNGISGERSNIYLST